MLRDFKSEDVGGNINKINNKCYYNCLFVLNFFKTLPHLAELLQDPPSPC